VIHAVVLTARILRHRLREFVDHHRGIRFNVRI
jgi:hypothetical protein